MSFFHLPSDPDKLVDQLKLIVLEKVRGKGKSMLSEQKSRFVINYVIMKVLQKINTKTLSQLLIHDYV